MRSVEDARPQRGLSVPVVTALDEAGGLIEADQRAIVRYVIQAGHGADVVFAAGTTGEWNRLPNRVRQQVVQVCVEEVAKANLRLSPGQGGRVEAWAGVTAHTASETLENLEFAIQAGADAAVLAPLAIRGVEDPVRFVAGDIADLLDERTRRIPIYLYDNAEIAVNPKVPHVGIRHVKTMSRLDFVRGIKVSASRRVLRNYTRASASFRERGEFGIYVGDAMLIFDLFRPPTGWLGAVSERWNRYRSGRGFPVGVVAGPANALPREWARAWQVCRAGDAERMDEVREVVAAFQSQTNQDEGYPAIACIKRALLSIGVISSAAVATGTPQLVDPEAERFDRAFEGIRAMARERIGPPWASVSSGDFDAALGAFD